MRNVGRTVLAGVFVAVTALAGTAALSAAQSATAEKKKPVEHAMTGTVEAVDSAAKTVSVKTADGTVHVFKTTDAAAVTGVKDGAKYTDLAAKKGTNVVVHYTEEGGKMTATGFDDFGKGTAKVATGTVTKVDAAAKTVTIKIAKGGEETFQMSDRATIDTAKGSAKVTEQGTEVTVHYTEDAGKKVAHFIKHPY